MEKCNSFETKEHVKNIVTTFDEYKLSNEQEEIIKKEMRKYEVNNIDKVIDVESGLIFKEKCDISTSYKISDLLDELVKNYTNIIIIGNKLDSLFNLAGKILERIGYNEGLDCFVWGIHVFALVNNKIYKMF